MRPLRAQGLAREEGGVAGLVAWSDEGTLPSACQLDPRELVLNPEAPVSWSCRVGSVGLLQCSARLGSHWRSDRKGL